MRILYNRSVAWLLSLLLVFVSIWMGAFHSLSGLRQHAQRDYEKGIVAGLEAVASQGYNMTTIAKRYLPPDDEKMERVLAARQALQESNSPAMQYARASELVDATRVLYNHLMNLPVAEQDQQLAQGLWVNVESELAVLSHNAYNEQARDYNEALQAFPANILAPLTGVKPLQLYA